VGTGPRAPEPERTLPPSIIRAMRAVVMAGGEGSRLRPLTSTQPKPMLPILGQPMMTHILRLAAAHGVTEVVATVHFLGSIVRNYFGDGSELGVTLEYSTEEEPLGTAGSVKNAQRLLGDTALVLSGDSLTDVDLSEVMRFHQQKGAAVTVTLKRVEDPLEFGIVIVDEDGRVQRFLEKPGWGDVFSDTINTGIYVVEREVLDLVPVGQEYDFSRDLFPLLLQRGLPIFGCVTDRFWTDVGTLEAFMAAQRAALRREVDMEIPGFDLGGGVWLGPQAELDPDAQITGPVYLGPNSRVEGGVTLREDTVLGQGVVVRSGAFLHRAVVQDYAYIGPSSSLRGCVVGRNADVKFGARLEEGVVVADECLVGEGAVLSPGIKVFPFKHVDPGAIVTKSIIWESGAPRGLFGDRGVSGLINVDITPEMGVRLALAYTTLLPRGSTIVTCRDVTRGARVLKRLMISGVNSAGMDVHDLELIPTPVARFYARSARAVGGFAVRTSPLDPASVDIQFFDEHGIDIGPGMQRQLERAYFRDEARRAFHHEIGELGFPARAREYYTRGLLDSVEVDLIRASRPKLVIDYAWGAAALTGPRVLGHLGGEVVALNALLDERRVITSLPDRRAQLEALARVVRSSGSALGAMMDTTGERLHLVDGAGRVLDGSTALLVFVWLVGRTMPGSRVTLPVAVSRVGEAMVEDTGGKVVWAPVSSSALMGTARREDVTLAGDESGGFVFPSFLPAPDAVMGLVGLLEMLTRSQMRLQDVVDELPPVHMARREVPTPWETKGTVMRRMIERLDGTEVLTVDGVKAFRGRDWALVVPHPQEPLVRVWAEASSDADAEALADEFAAMVREMKR
jgi:mannose-1-phosphate guanylyltransferase / phosphomannomutase